jgi:hypothetical protein
VPQVKDGPVVVERGAAFRRPQSGYSSNEGKPLPIRKGSLIFIAVGAILDFAVKVQNTHGVNVNKVGLIILIVGIIGLVVSLLFWSSWGGFNVAAMMTVPNR